MKKFKVCLAVLMMAMMMGGSAWAFNATDHVKVAPNGKGDLLIFPWYFAYPGGYATRITVINTSNSQSVVAKVVYRSFNWSWEVRDHLIFLSPNDVWTGNLVYVNGLARLQSNDDSILGRQPSGLAADADFGNITPVDIDLVPPGCPAEDANTNGYIEVIQAAARTESAATTGYVPGIRVAKRHIYDWYALLSQLDIQNTYPPVNVLTGYQENTFGLGSTLKQANVFADYGNYAKLNSIDPTRLGVLADNTLAELEAAMGKLNVALPYIARANGDTTVHIFNFPTKLSQYGPSTFCSYYRPYYENSLFQSPYWVLVNSKCETYTQNIYDLLENTPTSIQYPFSPPIGTTTPAMCGEVQFNTLSIGNPAYTEGWIRYNWGRSAALKSGTAAARTSPATIISYTGTPVLPSALYWTAARANPAEANSAYDDGTVSVNSGPLPYYQYSN